MPLNEYRKKRDFKISPEPSGETAAPKAPKSSLIYVIQKHRASQLHYDFRLEFRGTLLSWAIPKGPSLDPLNPQTKYSPVLLTRFRIFLQSPDSVQRLKHHYQMFRNAVEQEQVEIREQHRIDHPSKRLRDLRYQRKP